MTFNTIIVHVAINTETEVYSRGNGSKHAGRVYFQIVGVQTFFTALEAALFALQKKEAEG